MIWLGVAVPAVLLVLVVVWVLRHGGARPLPRRTRRAHWLIIAHPVWGAVIIGGVWGLFWALLWWRINEASVLSALLGGLVAGLIYGPLMVAFGRMRFTELESS